MVNSTQKQVRILCIYGNPKRKGFVHDCIEHIAARLETRGVEIDRLFLTECDIENCTGCFHCLRKGTCSQSDAMENIIVRIRQADGLVTGASVRNGFFPALYKMFYERITYTLGFTRELRGNYVLAVGAVGLAGGRKPLGKLLTFREFHTYVSDFLFFRTGIPTKKHVQDVAPKLDKATDRFYHNVTSKTPLPLTRKVAGAIDNFIIRKFMLSRNPDNVYEYVIAQWKDKGLL